MPYQVGRLALTNSVNGFGIYRYDTIDLPSEVEAAGYFNNFRDNLNFGTGDLIYVHTGSDISIFVVLDISAMQDATLGDASLSNNPVVLNMIQRDTFNMTQRDGSNLVQR